MMMSSTANSGYAMISVMEKVLVKRLGLLSEEELSDCTAMAQSSPGPVAINSSCLVGYRVAGLPGALAAMIGCALPPIVFMILVTAFYQFIVTNSYVALFMRGMQAGAVALVLNFAIGLFTGIQKKKDLFLWILAAISLVYIEFTGFPVYYLALFCIATAVAKTFLLKKKEGAEK
ncbi:MAG: chromate transporter [Mogibacterium sp.]|nr:chromate transporter [Mogibacterium sp.]